MFIDIVGFSLTSEKIGSKATYNLLSTYISTLTEMINKYDGLIDRSLGDGLLCYFGDESQKQRSQNHATRAFCAALAIQHNSTKLIALSRNQPGILFPVRIGLHSDKVFVGNLGGSSRIDFTMIGNGVNFASRLETAANPFRIMLSEQAIALMDKGVYDQKHLQEIYFKIKHKSSFIKAYEFDPFGEDRRELALWKKSILNRLTFVPNKHGTP